MVDVWNGFSNQSLAPSFFVSFTFWNPDLTTILEPYLLRNKFS
ncbi:hypothetical protein B1R32_11046 [Abditibacterium utsteinense]|uniref:Uncharacterized protein n=1 Tax=Abditibacterium utsteinense TaxID=1960156 RepID=A0A2S8SS00_9BACT|nr:hypothetical protein B1R32_11046 [Abditibacterium utsteinense]